jgi:polar amino acid transport system substrate-binding protein
MLTAIVRLVAVLALACVFDAPALAQAKKVEEQKLRVVTRVLPPLVVEQQGVALSGFSIELWNKIAERLKLKTSYQIAPDVRSLLAEVRAGKADVGVAAISITSGREEEFDFSQPILNAGLQIMVRGKGQEADSKPLWDLLGLLFSPTILVWLGIALLLILIPAHLVWFLERRHKDGIIPTDKYYPGIFYAMYWAAATLATQAEQAPRHWLARVVTVLWMFTGVVFVAFYTAQLAATLTVQQIQSGINGPGDLQGKKGCHDPRQHCRRRPQRAAGRGARGRADRGSLQVLARKAGGRRRVRCPRAALLCGKGRQGSRADGWCPLPQGGLRHRLPAGPSVAQAGQRCTAGPA